MINIIVIFLPRLLIASITACSVKLSSALVASSRIKLGLWYKALAIPILWRCPPDNLTPAHQYWFDIDLAIHSQQKVLLRFLTLFQQRFDQYLLPLLQKLCWLQQCHSKDKYFRNIQHAARPLYFFCYNLSINF